MGEARSWRPSQHRYIMLTCYTVLLVLVYVEVTLARSHGTFVLSSSMPGHVHDLGPVDGATIMSEEYYQTKNFTRSVFLQPSEPAARLLVQFVYVDLPERGRRHTFCQDSLSICEAGADPMQLFCDIGIITDFCGDLKELFASNPYIRRLHYVSTSNPGRALNIKWKVGDRIRHNRGFQLIVTSYLPESTECGQDARYWQCEDGRCVARALHCDQIPHCPDGTDELINCSTSGLLIPVGHDCGLWQGGMCSGRTWRERWFGLAIPMVIVMVLLLIAIFVRIRKQLRQPPPGFTDTIQAHSAAIAAARLRHIRQRRRIMTHHLAHNVVGSRACTLTPTVGQIIRQTPAVNMNYEPATVMLLPPPYSPPGCLPYEPPYDGDPPPEYSDIFADQDNDPEKSSPANSDSNTPNT